MESRANKRAMLFNLTLLLLVVSLQAGCTLPNLVDMNKIKGVFSWEVKQHIEELGYVKLMV